MSYTRGKIWLHRHSVTLHELFCIVQALKIIFLYFLLKKKGKVTLFNEGNT